MMAGETDESDEGGIGVVFAHKEARGGGGGMRLLELRPRVGLVAVSVADDFTSDPEAARDARVHTVARAKKVRT